MKWWRHSPPSPPPQRHLSRTAGAPQSTVGKIIDFCLPLHFRDEGTKASRCKVIHQGHHWLLHRLTLCLAFSDIQCLFHYFH